MHVMWLPDLIDTWVDNLLDDEILFHQYGAPLKSPQVDLNLAWDNNIVVGN